MMSDQTLNFNTETKPSTAEDLIGEGKKYATVEDAVSSIPHAQQHIAKLEEETAALRAELDKRASIEEQLKAFQEPSSPAPVETQPKVEVEGGKSALGAEDVLALIEAREAERAAEINVSKVTAALSGVYGSDAEGKFTAKAEELGLSVKDLSDMAKRSPKAVLAYFDIKESKPPQSTQGSVRTDSLSQGKEFTLPKTVMGGASTRDVKAMWDAVKQKVINEQ